MTITDIYAAADPAYMSASREVVENLLRGHSRAREQNARIRRVE
jgi:hypothetical protein